MSMKSQQKSVISKIGPKRVLKKNAAAFRVHDTYRKAAEIIERAEFASGKRVVFKSDTGSTINFEINRYGVLSTTSQKI